MKFNFDGQDYPYTSRRRVIYARRGMVCTSQPLSAQAGLAMLQQGGNAIDAAIATAICQTIVEPTNTGLGSDCFALVWVKDKLYGLNGSGYAPTHLTAEAAAPRAAPTKFRSLAGLRGLSLAPPAPGPSCTSALASYPLPSSLSLPSIMRKTGSPFRPSWLAFCRQATTNSCPTRITLPCSIGSIPLLRAGTFLKRAS